jgi:hypothetical protein
VTAKLVEHQFELENRGPIEVKGKGTMTTFLLVGPRGTLPDVSPPHAPSA